MVVVLSICVLVLSFVYAIGAIYKRNLYDSRYAFVGLTQFLSQIPCTCLPECFV